MEGVNHVDIVKVCGGSFVSDVNGMVQRKVPDGEGLELGIAGLHATLVLVIKLRKTGGHLAASGTGCRDNDEGSGSLDIIILAVSLFAYDEGNVIGYPSMG